MVRDGAELIIGPRVARTRWRLLTMRVLHGAARDVRVLRRRASAVSKDGPRRDGRHAFAASRHEMSELLETNHPQKQQRAQGMPDARCTRSRVCSKKHTR